MAELTQQERLQPSLLDRLTDDEPDVPQESRDKRVLSMRRLRESVLRDLGWLLNASRLDTLQDLGDHPFVARSVLNYGIPDIAGLTASGLDIAGLARAELVLRFTLLCVQQDSGRYQNGLHRARRRKRPRRRQSGFGLWRSLENQVGMPMLIGNTLYPRCQNPDR